jgi:LysR family transcriptional activator of nhaA
VVAEEAITRYRLQKIGATQECKEQFYAITAERKIVHPAALAITEKARAHLFSHPTK